MVNSCLPLLVLLFASTTAADLLQNGDFELPPANMKVNNTSPSVLLSSSDAIPGWSFNGTVLYLAASENISLPDNGHAVQLGQDGSINQTFKSDGSYAYMLTFSFAPGDISNGNCSMNMPINVSSSSFESSLFYLQESYGKEAWETHAWYWVNSEVTGKPISLKFQGQPSETDANQTCGLVIDTVLLKGVGTFIRQESSLLINSDFEIGPEFMSNSTEGILLDASNNSALQGWSVIGTVKYIDSKHYAVPQGNAAVEMSQNLGGIQQLLSLKVGSLYSLQFVMGDANDSCAAHFVLGVKAGSTSKNFTMLSTGTGATQNISMTFKASEESTMVSIVSYSTGQNKDFVFCGPVVDMVDLKASNGQHSASRNHVLFLILIMLGVLYS